MNRTEPMQPNENQRTIVSLLLFMHLFCVITVLSSNYLPSPLQQRLVAIVAPYTKSLHLDPNFVPFQITSGEDGLGRLHQWQVIKDGRIIARFPDRQWKLAFQHQRQDMFARVGGYYAADESLDDEVSATMARDLARHVLNQSSDNSRLRVRCVRYLEDANPSDATIDGADPFVIYEADVWQSDSGTMNVLKQTEQRRAAIPVEDD